LSVIEGLVKAGASRIIAVDLLPNKLELAKKWGATDTLNPKDLPADTTVQGKIVSIGHGSPMSLESVPARGAARRGSHAALAGTGCSKRHVSRILVLC